MIERQGKTVKKREKGSGTVTTVDTERGLSRQRGGDSAEGKREKKEGANRPCRNSGLLSLHSPSWVPPPHPPNQGCGREGLRRLLPRVIGTPSSLCWSQPASKPFQPLPRGFLSSPRIYFITVGGTRPSPQQVPFLDPPPSPRTFLSFPPPAPQFLSQSKATNYPLPVSDSGFEGKFGKLASCSQSS